MAKRPKKSVFPKRTKPQTTVFQGDKGPTPAQNAAPMNPRASNGSPHTGLTTNRSKPGGGHGSAGKTTSAKLPGIG